MQAKLDSVGIVVSDMPAALAFYRRLGCAFGPDEDEPHAQCDLGGGVSLMLDTVASLVELGMIDGPPPPGSRDAVALAVRCDTPSDVDALYGQLAADGFGLREPWDAPWGQRYATLTDPDGTHVDLYAVLRGTPT